MFRAKQDSDENLPREGVIPVRRMSNFGVLDLAAQRALSDHVLIQGERFSDFVSSVRRMEAPLERTG